jgi:hypothetical protein
VDEADFWDLVFACAIAGGRSLVAAVGVADDALEIRRLRRGEEKPDESGT